MVLKVETSFELIVPQFLLEDGEGNVATQRLDEFERLKSAIFHYATDGDVSFSIPNEIMTFGDELSIAFDRLFEEYKEVENLSNECLRTGKIPDNELTARGEELTPQKNRINVFRSSLKKAQYKATGIDQSVAESMSKQFAFHLSEYTKNNRVLSEDEARTLGILLCDLPIQEILKSLEKSTHSLELKTARIPKMFISTVFASELIRIWIKYRGNHAFGGRGSWFQFVCACIAFIPAFNTPNGSPDRYKAYASIAKEHLNRYEKQD